MILGASLQLRWWPTLVDDSESELITDLFFILEKKDQPKDLEIDSRDVVGTVQVMAKTVGRLLKTGIVVATNRP